MLFELRLRGGVGAPMHARHALQERLVDILDESVLSDLAVLISEVVTNAVRHGGGGARAHVRIRIELQDDMVTVFVTDPVERFGSSQTPAPRLPRSGGLGLMLLDQLSTRWGVERVDEGTRVWFRLNQAPRRLGSVADPE
jgi:anti-sigma regulatory factor (Ser/Thr protein kinase)